ncbi:MAG: indolepyruvate oxidoreductase subunit beta [Clostridia bacterium]|nr:indolepyruvate oxidoreductase subunit beta [Clostridia bacterium]
MNTKSIMIVGVGGQGTLLASRILGNLAIEKGYDVKVSEVHGMSQRGGSVVTYVKYGEKVHSPVICQGEADIIISFEELEALRWLPYLKKGGKLITNVQQIMPMPVIIGAAEYPGDILDTLKKEEVDLVAVNALEIAESILNSKVTNVVLLGVLAKYLEFDKQDWVDAVLSTVPEKFKEANEQAFLQGYEQ